MQSYYLNRVDELRRAIQELSINAKVTGYKCIGDRNVIEIEPTERYQSGQVIHNCELVFK